MMATPVGPACSRITLDHVGFVGADLETMSESFRHLGFAPTQARALMRRDPSSGRTVPLDQMSCHLVFETGYVELSALSTRSPSHHLASYASRYHGLHILAFGVSDIEATAERVRSVGIPMIEPALASREISYGSRTGTAKFRWFMLQPAAAPDALICFVQHLNADLVLQPEVQRHPNTAIALRNATIVTSDPKGTARLLGEATGCSVEAAKDAWQVELSGSKLHVYDERQFSKRYPGMHMPVPSMAAISIAVRDVSIAVELSRSSGIHIHVAQDRTWIEPQDAAGAVIEFVD